MKTITAITQKYNDKKNNDDIVNYNFNPIVSVL